MSAALNCKRCDGRPSTAGPFCGQCGCDLLAHGIMIAKGENARHRLEFMKVQIGSYPWTRHKFTPKPTTPPVAWPGTQPTDRWDLPIVPSAEWL